MDHFARIFEAGGRGSGGSGGSGGISNHMGSSDDEGIPLRAGVIDSPFKIKKSGPPDFDFVCFTILSIFFSV